MRLHLEPKLAEQLILEHFDWANPSRSRLTAAEIAGVIGYPEEHLFAIAVGRAMREIQQTKAVRQITTAYRAPDGKMRRGTFWTMPLRKSHQPV